MLILEIVAVLIILVEAGVIPEVEQVKDITAIVTDKLESSLIDVAKDKPAAWWDWQKALECCGWANNTIPDPLATGKFCTQDTDTSHPPCKEKLLDTGSGWLVGAFGGILFIAQSCVCMSSWCLCYWIQAEEPCY